MKINEIAKNIRVKIKPIKNIKKYRGFYFKLDDGYVVANFCSCPSKGLIVEYSLGFEVNEGNNIVSHLFNKLEENKKLTKNEQITFYEKVDLFNPFVQYHGAWYDFKEVLHKVPALQFYTLNKKISKKEIDIFYEYVNDFVDIRELGSL